MWRCSSPRCRRKTRSHRRREPPYLGLDHIGLRVEGIDTVVAELKQKGAEFTVEPKTIRPGVRIAFLRGPQNVLIELLDRNAA